MAKNLIIVESPAKVKTIKKFLGGNYNVQASVGHIRDLPTNELGVDEAAGFVPKYQVIEGKQKVVDALKSAAGLADTVFLAPDPDREGEAIAWHVAELIKDKAKNIKRIQFNEITAKAVREALENPRDLDAELFDAQQARRVLDRLVGYKISPLLWKNVKRGISAGRVQSVALRIIVEREEERRAFKAEEYWLFKALLAAGSPPAFKADLHKVEGKKPRIPDGETAKALENTVRSSTFTVTGLEEKERGKSPAPPFITSTLQQAASQRFGYPAKRTMSLAQRLYEGVDLGDLGTVALITYMRTDSFRIADEARVAASDFVDQNFGADYLPKKPRAYKSKGSSQDAHEAVRPVDVKLTPDMLKGRLAPDQYNVYRLVWSRFLASQMADARFHDTVVTITAGPTEWRSKGERMLFPGWLAAYGKVETEEPAAETGEAVELPKLQKGETLDLQKLVVEQKFTQPPPRYSEASLVRELEEKGIGRPSTYASIISTLQDRDYARMEEKHFAPTDLGELVCDQLRQHFVRLMDVGFTAQMEESLDQVAEGQRNWVDLMREFYNDFSPTLAAAAKNMQVMKSGVEAGILCPECGKPLMVKFGKAGTFLACSGYPECRYTSNFTRTESGEIVAVAKEKSEHEVVGTCPMCQSDLILRQSRTGSRFIACSAYPKCKYTASMPTGVPCPKCGQGMLVEKSSKRGKVFYSCDRFPNCDYALWNKPVAQECPKCGSPLMVEKIWRGSKRLACADENCGKAEKQDQHELVEIPEKKPAKGRKTRDKDIEPSEALEAPAVKPAEAKKKTKSAAQLELVDAPAAKPAGTKRRVAAKKAESAD